MISRALGSTLKATTLFKYLFTVTVSKGARSPSSASIPVEITAAEIPSISLTHDIIDITSAGDPTISATADRISLVRPSDDATTTYQSQNS
ncbi:hypothetical protein T484DRAFT_1778476 [Baffinella frigidus]|nr:hypothetical protein T484DRAFT_1778476 [Cryptophyta sp. CCMP2293]